MSKLRTNTIENLDNTSSIDISDVELKQESYINLGEYETVSTPVNYNNTLTVDGAVYRLKTSTIAPYTLNGDWTTDSANLVLLGDDALRQELLNGTATVNAESVVSQYGALADNLDDVYRLHPQQNSTAVVTVYCDPVAGDDANPGTLVLPYKTFQRAVDGCPRILTHQYVIDLRSAPAARGGLPVTYDEDIVIRDIHAPMTRLDTPLLVSSGLRVLGAGPTVGTHNPADVEIGSLTVAGCTGIANPEIYGFTATRISPFYEQEEYVAVYGTQEAQFYNLAFKNTDGTKAGVRPYGSGVVVKGIDVTGLRHAVWAKRGAYAVMQTVYGVQSPGSTYRSDEGSLVSRVGPDTVTGRTDPRDLVNYSYGLLHSQNGVDFVRGMYYGSLALNSTLGTDALALGYNVTASGESAVAAGAGSEALGTACLAFGANAKSGLAGVASCVAIGQGALANVARRATAIGQGAQALFENSMAIGYAAVVSAANRIRLGNTSVSAVETQNAYEVLANGGSIYMRSPNGTRYRLSISDAGAVVVVAAP